MRADRTRAGGRHLLRERDGYGEPIAVEVYEPTVMRGPMIERLDGASLVAVAGWMGCTVEGLLGRYEGTSLTV